MKPNSNASTTTTKSSKKDGDLVSTVTDSSSSPKNFWNALVGDMMMFWSGSILGLTNFF